MSVIKPCPWCDGTKMDWSIPPYSSVGFSDCEDCGARGPSFYVTDIRGDRAAITARAIETWNGSRQS